LEKIADSLGGKLLVAKLDTEAEQALAAQFGIRSLPTVKLFRNGRPVDEFMGALPESEVRAFVERHLPRESDQLLRQADGLLGRGAVDDAADLIGRARGLDPDNPRVLLAEARLLAIRGQFDDAERALDALPLGEHDKPPVLALRARITFDRATEGSPDAATLRQRLADAPQDSEARYRLASRLAIEGQYEEALEQLLTLLRRDRRYGDDAARKGMLLIFELLGGQGELVSRYRGRMTSALF
jgi:putative thioredoxin